MEQLSEAAPDWERLSPLLDEAMSALSETDYDAVVMRFFKNQDLRSVGRALGVTDDAAQKRVSRALDKLREELSRRGIRSSAGALSIVLSANAVHAAPAELAASISSAAVAGTTVTAVKGLALTGLEKAFVSLIVAASVAAPLVVQHQAQGRLREQQEAARQQTIQLTDLHARNDHLLNELARARNTAALSEPQLTELLRLRGEVGRLRRVLQEQAQQTPPARLSREEMLASMSQAFSDRAWRLRAWLQTHPSERIPELQFLSDSDWASMASRFALDTEDGYRQGSSWSRETALVRFANDVLQPALWQYAREHSGQFPTDVYQLNPYFKAPVDDSLMSRWEILPIDNVAAYLSKQLAGGDAWVIAPKAPVDPTLDLPAICSMSQVVRAVTRPSNQWVRTR